MHENTAHLGPLKNTSRFDPVSLGDRACDRIVLAALWIPSIIWLFLTFKPIVAVPLFILVSYAFFRVTSPARSGPNEHAWEWRFLLPILVFSALWSAFTGLPKLFFINSDWLVRLEILKYFASPAWPVYVNGGTEFILRFPGAYYALPALFASGLDIDASRYVLWFITALLGACGLAALFFRSRSRHVGMFLLIVLLINGLDLLSVVTSTLAKHHAFPPFGTHVEFWLGLQYSGLTTAMTWVPNHFLPALFFVGTLPLTVERASNMRSVEVAMLAAVGTMLWSPLVFLGTLPILAGLAIPLLSQSLRDREIVTRALLVWLPIFIVALGIELYLTLGTGPIHKGTYFSECTTGLSKCTMRLAAFYVFEAIPLAVLCAWLPNKHIGIPAALTLLVLPLFVFGPSDDLVMRTSLPAIIIAAVSLLCRFESTRSKLMKGALVVYVAVAGYSSMSEIQRGLSHVMQTPWRPVGIIQAFQQTFPNSLVNGYPPHYMLPVQQACASRIGPVLKGCGK